jgi:hypothetical protein
MQERKRLKLDLSKTNKRYQLQSAKICSAKTPPDQRQPPTLLSFCITTHNQTPLLFTRTTCPSVCLGSGNMQCANKTVDAPKRGANTFATRGRGLSAALCLAVSEMGRIQLLGCGCTKPWVFKFASGAALNKYCARCL